MRSYILRQTMTQALSVSIHHTVQYKTYRNGPHRREQRWRLGDSSCLIGNDQNCPPTNAATSVAVVHARRRPCAVVRDRVDGVVVVAARTVAAATFVAPSPPTWVRNLPRSFPERGRRLHGRHRTREEHRGDVAGVNVVGGDATPDP